MTNVNDETQDQNVIEETHENTSTEGETETTAEQQETTDDAGETVTIPKQDFDRLKASLAKKARLESKGKKDSTDSNQDNPQGYDQDLIARTYLAAQAGVTDPEVQDEALRLANKFGMKIDQAMRDADISTRLNNLQKQKQTQAGIAGNGGQNVGKPKSIDQYLAEFKKTNALPDDPRLVSKILDALTKSN